MPSSRDAVSLETFAQSHSACPDPGVLSQPMYVGATRLAANNPSNAPALTQPISLFTVAMRG